MAVTNRGPIVKYSYMLISLIYYIFSKILIRSSKHGAIVLCYHGVTFSEKKNFAKQMKMIKSRAVTQQDMIENIQYNNKHFPVYLTFDDAFENLIHTSIPIINHYHIPITIFIPIGNLGEYPKWLKGSNHADSDEKIMSREQLKNLSSNPLISWGSHTVDHKRLTSLSEKEIRKQLRISRETISDLLDVTKVNELALPHGDYNNFVIRLAIEEGYKRIYSLDPVICKDSDISSHLVGRFNVTPKTTLLELFLILNGSYAWLSKWRVFTSRIFLRS